MSFQNKSPLPPRESLRRLSAATNDSPWSQPNQGKPTKGKGVLRAPSFLQRLFPQSQGRRAGIKILHEDVERTVNYAVRRNSMKKEGMTPTEIASLLGTEKAPKPLNKEEKFLIHPDSRYRLWWDMITAIFVLYLIWLVPFSVGFDSWYPTTFLYYLNWFIDGWFILDVILNFRTGFVDHGVMVLDSKRIVKNYLQSYFVVDFLASFPWEAVFGAEHTKSGGVSSRKALKIFKYFKLPKLLRISRMIRFFNKYARFYGLTLSMTTMVMMLHISACMLATLITDVCLENNGFFKNETTDMYFFNDTMVACESAADTVDCSPHLCATTDVFVMYSEALFMSMSMMVGSPLVSYVGSSFSKQSCIGAHMTHLNATSYDEQDELYFGIDPVTGNETVLGAFDESLCPKSLMTLLEGYREDNWHFVVVTIFMFLGVTQISLLIGHLGLVLQSKYQASAAFRLKLDRVKAECEYYKVPWDLQNRVFAYYDYLWVNQKQYDDKILLMNDRGMSSDLRGKLALFLYKDVIQGVTLFERVDDTFLSKICMELQTRVYLPQDWVILKGDIGSELFIISRGIVQVFVVDPMEEISDDEDDGDGMPSEAVRATKRNNLLKAAEEESVLLRRGQFFGEVSLLMETRRTTSVQARTVTELNVLVQEVFEEILRESPEFAEEMKNLRASSGVSGGSARNIGIQPRLSGQRLGRATSTRSELRTYESSRSFVDAEEDPRMMQDVISMQIATLQERTDKVFAMLTTKLGRVR
ncbi:hypothetical protein TeGR_g1413 [Tetraparma gracilis]|uniref:Cyclic nucleotide-binding domain-containing protein n=1 Tax=Tetraparma gracilis TaxID=2962635 RepID=A0ABQ6MLP4_9STRA|nr:hypothetical protein TeGR_g1413 [Tetraparma gracilis]